VLAANATSILVSALEAPGRARRIQRLDLGNAARGRELKLSAAQVQGITVFVSKEAVDNRGNPGGGNGNGGNGNAGEVKTETVTVTRTITVAPEETGRPPANDPGNDNDNDNDNDDDNDVDNENEAPARPPLVIGGGATPPVIIAPSGQQSSGAGAIVAPV
jgi:hypothetical protein